MHAGSQSVHPAARPEDSPYLLQEDLQNNQTQSDKHSGTQPVEETTTRIDIQNVSESANRSDSERALESGSDLPTITVTHLQSGAHSDANSTKLVRILQISAVHKGHTER